jgi:serine protease inhibitor
LALSEVIQEVFVSVDEEGSTARVATSTRPADQQRAPDVELTFDRPFLVWIVDRSSRLPLIAARVGDPTQ